MSGFLPREPRPGSVDDALCARGTRGGAFGPQLGRGYAGGAVRSLRADVLHAGEPERNCDLALDPAELGLRLFVA